MTAVSRAAPCSARAALLGRDAGPGRPPVASASIGMAAVDGRRAPVESRELRFEDRADGAVAVYEATHGPSRVRGRRRAPTASCAACCAGSPASASARRSAIEPPFRLTRWDDGRLSLEDPSTGRRIDDLEAFGPTNAAAFAQLLDAQGASAMIGTGSTGRQAVEVPCTIDIENTLDSLHAYVELQGVEVGPGDEVLVHDAPTEMPPYGERVVVRAPGRGGAGRLARPAVDPADRALRAHRALRSRLLILEMSMNEIVLDRVPERDHARGACRTPCSARASTPPTSRPWTGSTSAGSGPSGTS